ncbi:WhiB family transcriptional regulator [Rhodococcoides kyotonense]|uniref:WhiB family transcriptional regulator n=1 Tax=Rhodococcoides kyotonense TaxID=398843 RepID=UPI001FE5A0E0|nr:WhiB family transcriptional regulator [Rhodococcus kyotonensis]
MKPEWEWQRNAACRTRDSDIFYADDERPAKRICSGCPVVQRCLQVALDAAKKRAFGEA